MQVSLRAYMLECVGVGVSANLVHERLTETLTLAFFVYKIDCALDYIQTSSSVTVC